MAENPQAKAAWERDLNSTVKTSHGNHVLFEVQYRPQKTTHHIINENFIFRYYQFFWDRKLILDLLYLHHFFAGGFHLNSPDYQQKIQSSLVGCVKKPLTYILFTDRLLYFWRSLFVKNICWCLYAVICHLFNDEVRWLQNHWKKEKELINQYGNNNLSQPPQFSNN